MAEPHPTVKAAFIDRAKAASHPLSSYLLRLMDLKASNLCLSADVTSARELLVLADRVGPSIVVLKTHHDIVSGWDYNPGTGTGARLATLARKHGFLIFEDRKFGDIGNTVQMQYTAGAGRIIEWAHMVTVNMVPGPAVVTALADAAARWTERWPYEVRTLVSVGTPKANNFDDGDDEKNGEAEGDRGHSTNSNGNHDGGDDKLTVSGGGGGGGEMDPNHPAGSKVNNGNGRKGSIVSITTVTQHYEPAPSPRGSNLATKGDEELFQGIEEAPIDRGLLILAQMSSTGNFMGPDYTRACVEAARLHRGFVMGFVSQQSLNSAPDDTFIHMTPGCQIPPEEEHTGGGGGGDGNGSVVGGDGKGQNYNTPQRLVEGCGADIVIVGRGILHAANQQSEAERYRREAWRAYLSRIHDSRPEGGGGCPA